MRSVVVVFPASMCAMIPMLRVLARRAAVVLTLLLQRSHAAGANHARLLIGGTAIAREGIDTSHPGLERFVRRSLAHL
jgi:hypothetical protein